MKLKSLLLGTSLSLIPNLTHSQCVATTDCATLGYTETSCPDGKGLRCPFGNTFACPTSEASFCSKYGFKHTCSGTGYKGGAGTACNNQYAYCTCSAGYEWKNEKCEESKATLGTCTGYTTNCAIGDILNSDGTCTSDKVSGKSLLGVVVAIKDNCGYAMTINPIVTDINWSSVYFSTNTGTTTSWQTAITIFDACANTRQIAARGGPDYFPAAWAAINYSPTAAQKTQGSWCLPATGILNSLYNNLSTINNTISKLGGTQLLIGGGENIWSSSEHSSNYAWTSDMGAGDGNRYGGITFTHKSYYNSVRPVLEF